MPNQTNLDLINIDFDYQEQSLITFLRSQDQFKDYDFTGANLNALLDLLTNNTLKLAFYYNFTNAESWLDSAQLRASILSHAKELNYTPRSALSPMATVNVAFQATGENQPYIIPQGASFNSLIKNNSFVFSVPQTLICASANTTFSFQCNIFEGSYVKDSYVVVNSSELQRYRITNQNIDTSSLSVVIYEDNSLIGQKYSLATTLLDLGPTDLVYFLQNTEGYYEVLFGNGVLGAQPNIGSTIILDYRVTKGPSANGASIFTIAFDPTAPPGLNTGNISELLSSPIVTTVQTATGGYSAESIESIRFTAPRFFQVQERSIVANDAVVLLKQQFPEIQAVSVFGGETLTPPMYGRIFVSVDISNVQGLPQSKATEYANFLKGRCALTMRPVIISPDFTFIEVDSLVRYNINISNFSTTNIQTIVVSAIDQYNTNFLNNFNVTLRFSQLMDLIDNSDPSIVSNITMVRLYKKLQPALLNNQNISIKFALALNDTFSHPDNIFPVTDLVCLQSSQFNYYGRAVSLCDDGDGKIFVVSNDGNNFTKVASIGTINYTTGLVQLNNFFINGFDGASLNIYVRPSDLDVIAPQNTILGIEPPGINISVQFLSL